MQENIFSVSDLTVETAEEGAKYVPWGKKYLKLIIPWVTKDVIEYETCAPFVSTLLIYEKFCEVNVQNK